jgi:FdrA protein
VSARWRLCVVPGRYADSVRLMAVAREVRGRDGVHGCEIGMGTLANLAALADLGVRAEAGPGDLVIAVHAEADAGEAALAAAEAALRPVPVGRADGGPREAPPRSTGAALAALPGANLALVSVPGEYAALEAHRALSSGLHVFLFSDHVSEADEIALKRRGADAGLLVMGPECGTAMLGGVGLGFANAVRRGPVGIVAAAGTGAQEAACLLDAAGVGVSQIVGVGGRDLSEAVGGIMFREGMRALGADPETETLLLVSKPPAPRVVRALADAVPAGVRVVAAFVGWTGDSAPFEVHPTLEAGALAAAGRPHRTEGDLDDSVAGRAAGRRLLGLFSGGSLAHEALTLLEPVLGPIGGNLTGREPAGGHTILDLGEEEYTRGRPHPMVDLGVRLEMLREAAADPDLGCVVLDVVLGYGAHPNPAPELAPALAPLAARALVVARVCGTVADPQDAPRQEAVLSEAGVVVAPSNASAARLAGLALTGSPD